MIFKDIKPKLLITVDTYYPKKDGVLIFLERTMPSLSKIYDITILAPRFSKDQKPIKGCKLISLPISEKVKIAGYKSIRLSLENKRTIIENVKDSDIIFSQDLAPIGALSIYYAKKFKKPILSYIHQITWEQAVDVLKVKQTIKDMISTIIKKLVKSLYNRCDLILIPYGSLQQELTKKDIFTKTKVIKLGVDTEQFKPPIDKDDAKRSINISPDLKVIGYCGRLSKEKDLETLRKAFKQSKRTFKKSCLLIVGSGPQIKDFEGLKDTHITGFVKDPVPYYQAMDIFVMPSLTETTSLATLEAMSCGLTVISTKVGFIKDYIKDRFNGFFFPKKNIYVLSKKLDILLRNNIIRQEIGKYARQKVIKEFSWQNTIKDLEKTFEKFC